MRDRMERLYPLPRSLTGDGVRETLRILGEAVPLQTVRVPSGTEVFDWTIGDEWNVREAYVADASGRRVVDVAEHTLHLVGYSVPVRTRLPLAELRPHLHTLPDHPDWIPYRTSYYHRDWGFCLTAACRGRSRGRRVRRGRRRVARARRAGLRRAARPRGQ